MEPKASGEPGGPGDQPDLQLCARRWMDGLASAEELHREFLTSTLFLEAGDRPGLMALGERPEGLVPVWTSEREMARSLGAEAAWFSTTGADLLSLLPAGYDLLLDADGDGPLRLRTSAVRRDAQASVVWEPDAHAPRS